MDITKFDLEVTEGIPSPCIVNGLHAPQGLIDAVAEQRGMHAALRGVVAATITTCRAVSTVNVQQSMDVAIHSL